MNPAERELMQRVQALPIGRELRIHYAELWRAVSDDNAPPSPEQERGPPPEQGRGPGLRREQEPPPERERPQEQERQRAERRRPSPPQKRHTLCRSPLHENYVP